MHDKITHLLQETRKILRYHQEMGIDEYPAAATVLEPSPQKSAAPQTGSPLDKTPPRQKTTPSAGVPQAVRTLTEIRDELGDCRRCHLHAQRNRLVFGEGNDKARLLVIGGWPGLEADQTDSLYAGKAGEMLRNMFKAIELTTEDVYVSTLVKCRPAQNNPPDRQAMLTCQSFLEQQIKAIAPQIIWILGKEAAQALLKTSRSIIQLRGHFHDLLGIPAMVSFHPDAMLQNMELKKPTWLDLQAIQRRLQSPKSSSFKK